MMGLSKVILTAIFLGVWGVANIVKADPGVVGQPRSLEPQAYNRVVDQALRAIRAEVGDNRYDITVADLDEFILLQGEVDSESTRSKVVEVVRSTTSKRVRDELRVRPGPSDSQIAERVKVALRQDDPALAERVHVEVRNGVAYLSGDLRNHREVDQILATTLMVDGVSDVRSDLTLGGRPYFTQRVGRSRY